MKKNIRYWLLIVLATTSLNLFGQNDTLKFKKKEGYNSFISLKDFIEEINQDKDFSLKLRDTVLTVNRKQKAGDDFKSIGGDENIKLNFPQKFTRKGPVKQISVQDILFSLTKNPTFNENLLVRFTPSVTQKKEEDPPTPPIKESQQKLADDILKKLNLGENKQAKQIVTKALSKGNFVLEYWWIISLLGIAFFTISAWYLSAFRFRKKLFKALNNFFYPENPKEITDEYDVKGKLQVKYQGLNVPPPPVTDLTDKHGDIEKQLQKWIDLAGDKSFDAVKSFLEDKGFYNSYREHDSNNTYMQQSEQEKGDVFYFSSVNRDGDLGVFQDENKTSYKEPDSIYRFEIKKSNRNEAEFWYDATNPSYALSYRSYIIDPFCTSQAPFQEGNTRIIHEKKGTARLDNGRWIVSKKAEIMYN